MPESFNTIISQQPYDYKITFVNLQREKTNFKVDFVLKYWFEMFVIKISGRQK